MSPRFGGITHKIALSNENNYRKEALNSEHQSFRRNLEG
jgi:hypothetical protein